MAVELELPAPTPQLLYFHQVLLCYSVQRMGSPLYRPLHFQVHRLLQQAPLPLVP